MAYSDSMKVIKIILALVFLIVIPAALLVIAGIIMVDEGWVAGLIFLVLATLMTALWGGAMVLIVGLLMRLFPPR